MRDGLLVAGALCWVAFYLEALRLGVTQRTYAVPLWAMGYMVAWDTTYCLQAFAQDRPGPEPYALLAWAVCDYLVLGTYVLWGQRHWSRRWPPGSHLVWGLLALAVGWMIVSTFQSILPGEDGAIYCDAIMNFLMSVLYVIMYAIRGSTRGQSVFLAGIRLLGDALITLAYGVFDRHWIALGCGIISLLIDGIYIYLLTTDGRLNRAHERASARLMASAVS